MLQNFRLDGVPKSGLKISTKSDPKTGPKIGPSLLYCHPEEAPVVEVDLVLATGGLVLAPHLRLPLLASPDQAHQQGQVRGRVDVEALRGRGHSILLGGGGLMVEQEHTNLTNHSQCVSRQVNAMRRFAYSPILSRDIGMKNMTDELVRIAKVAGPTQRIAGAGLAKVESPTNSQQTNLHSFILNRRNY